MTEYDSATRRPRIFEELRDLVRYRDLLAALIANNLKTRYKRSALGVAWTLLNPLVTMLVTTVAFSGVFRSSLPGYPVYVLSGLLVWNFFSQSTAVAMHQLVWNGGHLLKRVYLPRTIFCVAAVGTGAVNLALGLAPLVAIMAALGRPPTAALLFLPLAAAIALAFVLGAALCLSALAVFFTDVIEIFQAAVTAFFYVTPVLYPAGIIPPRFAFIVAWNPMSYVLDTFRDPIYLGRVAPAGTVLVAAAAAATALIAGFALFTWKADEIAYRA